ncbi:SIS domain-containing protein [Micromonospora inositola]|uniref:Glutamine--fructose-6-phosphate aminotransferase [isomerizing] n=1 Tax=Micromonospora inositola TaxID=47865 RepID=A0A1C5JTE7_9ACTN|nr:SIS domain-containing protein [Micromonospora inositola]SCG73306.1 Fructoselysine-6-P-deglycase FrlB with duplicated sugar isomerase (SIS) domain [Micromonospora inositola]
MTVAYLAGVRAQPDNLRRSAETVRAALAGPAGAQAAAASRWGSLLAFGMGASSHAAAGFAAVLRAGGLPAISASAADLHDGVPPGLAAAFLGISQSGRSRDTVDTLAGVPAGPAARLALTNHPDSPLGAAADTVVTLGCALDTPVSTLSYTATLQALGLLAERISGRPQTDWDLLPDLAAEVLEDDVEPLAEALTGAGCVDAVASGVRLATAGAAALLLREAAHLPTASFATHEYLHGPLETAGPGHAVLLFGAGREVSLAADLAGYGARVVLVTDAEAGEPTHDNLRVVRLPGVAGLGGCVLDILPVQLAAQALAERAGRPIELRHMPADTKLPPG